MRYSFFSVAVLFAVWTGAAYLTPSIILPSPAETLLVLFDMASGGGLFISVGTTLFRVAAGFAAGMLIGTSAGFAAGISGGFYRFTKPYISMMQSIPRLSWILIATFWFGLTPAVVIFLVAVTVIPFFYINVSDSVRYTDRNMMEVAEIYGMSSAVRFTDIYLPSAMGAIMSASSTAVSVSWKAVIMAELLSVPTGIGAGMSIAQSNIDMPSILAYTAVVALFAWGSSSLITLIFDRYLKRRSA